LLPPGFHEVELADGFGAPGHGDPVDVTWAPDGRMFIADRNGVVFAHNPGDPPATNTPILNIKDHVNNAHGGDRGLLGIATDVDFASNGYLYLLYTYDASRKDRGGPAVSTLTRVTVHSDNTVDGGVNTPVETTILGKVHTPGHGRNGACGRPSNSIDCIPSDYLSHSIGTVRSAPDGTLFVGTGDGNNFNKVDRLAFNDANPKTYRGKIMHVDRNGNGLPGHPFCRSDANLTHVCTKIYARGLRNPFRFNLRPGGGLVIGDVGQDAYEEIDLAHGGEDFGWPCFEGFRPTTLTNNYSRTPFCRHKRGRWTRPAFAIPQPNNVCKPGKPSGDVVIGGPVYQGTQYPRAYSGRLFFGDAGDFGPGFPRHCGWLGTARISGHKLVDYRPFATQWPIGVDIESAPDGNIVYVSLKDHAVREIVYTGQ
jgi:glucose/arabinose dehydrogenase